MYIGEFARLAGTTPKAVRLYEQLGLLPEPRRRGKYRVYRAEDLEWVGFIRQAQRLGCKLGELVPLLAGVTSLDHFPWQKVEQLIAGKLAQIEAEVARLQRQHQALSLPIGRYLEDLFDGFASVQLSELAVESHHRNQRTRVGFQQSAIDLCAAPASLWMILQGVCRSFSPSA